MVGTLTWSVREIGKTESTQSVAQKLASEGAAEGVVVVAQEQYAGTGRYGRAWVSPRGGLYMSLILRPRRPSALQLLPITASLAIIEGIRQVTGLSALMRWPNDVVLQGKKVAGAIAEASYRGQSLSYVVLGIGINCNFEAASLGELASSSTTLMDCLGQPVDAGRLRDSVLSAFASPYSDWSTGRPVVKISEMRDSISTIGKRVEIELRDGRVVACRVTGVGQTGSLIAELDGREVTFGAQDVERLRELPELT